jgi:DNA-binding transcriptional regulator YiaG
MQAALPSMLLFREGEIRAASRAVSTLWIALSTGESAESVRLPPKILAKRRDERELEELAHVFPLVVFEETASARKATSGRDMLRRLSTCLELSFENVGRILNVPGETVRRWERGISRIPSDALATLELVDSALNRLSKLFLPQRLPEVVRRKADLFNGGRALDWILQGRIANVVDRYEQVLSYQG